MKQNKLLLIVSVCLLFTGIHAQKVSCLSYRNLMALGYGKGYTRCFSELPGGDAEEYFCRTNDYIYTLNINNLSHSKKSGVKFGIYLDGTLGLSFSEYYIKRSRSSEVVWRDDYGALMNLNAGVQGGYYFHEYNMVVGLRYFNNYNIDQIRSGYGNSDDPATLGLFFTKDAFDGDVSYGHDKIPGFLVRSSVWDILRFNLKYNIPRKKFEDGDVLMVVGLRYEQNFLKTTDSYLSLNGIDKARANSFWFYVGMRL